MCHVGEEAVARPEFREAGLLVTGASCAAHAILAARGEWITNEKQLLTRAGLREMDDLLGAPDEAIDLCAARSRQRCAADLGRTRKT